MKKHIHVLLILCGLTSSSIIITIQAKTESLSFDNIKSPIAIFQKHIHKIDAMNPDNEKEVKRVLHLCCEAISIEMAKYIKLIRKEKYTTLECKQKAQLAAKAFCISHHISANELDQLLSAHDCRIAKFFFESIIQKYISQHKIIEKVIGYNPGHIFYYSTY